MVKLRYKLFCTIVLIVVCVFGGTLPVGNNIIYATQINDNPALNHYFKLTNLYMKWHQGLFGSRKVNKRYLEAFLLNLIGKEIETEKTFVLRSPDGYMKRYVECKFSSCRWMYIYGEIDKKSLLEFSKKNRDIKHKVLRSTVMFGVRGVIRKYRLGRDAYGDTVEIYLYGISIVP